jgi:hypothetical protein
MRRNMAYKAAKLYAICRKAEWRKGARLNM